MHKKIGVAAGLILMAMPIVAAADVQSEIAALLAKVSALQSQLSLSQWTSPGALTAQASTAVGSSGTCVNLTRNLYRPLTDATTGGEVTKLQNFLIAKGALAAGNATGNFGQLTEAAVQKYQSDTGIETSGTPESNGFGYVGLRTRGAMSCGGSGAGTGGGTRARDANFRAVPFSGPAPLDVLFIAPRATTANEFSVDFGDGTSAPMTNPNTCVDTAASCGFGIVHRYTTNGTYIAKLKKKDAGTQLVGGCDSAYCRDILGIANTSVTNVVAQATITVGPRSASGTSTTVPPTETGVAGTTGSTSTGLSAREQIQLLYLGYLGRSGDAAGIEYWANQVKNGLPALQVAQSIALSDEAQKRNPYLLAPSVADPEVFVEAVYQRLFSRTPDAAGKAHWLAELKARGNDPRATATIVLEIISGANVSSTDLKTMLGKIPGANTNRDTTTGTVKTTGILVKFTGGTLVATASFDSNDCDAAGFRIDWGDSRTDTLAPTTAQCVNGATISGGPIGYGITHTYQNVGTYIVKLFKGTATTPLSSAVFIATR